MTPEQQLALDKAMAAKITAILKTRKVEFYQPYPKQAAFHRMGGDPEIRERLLIAGNQCGKTLGASFETAFHLTGDYPDWWEGAEFREPTIGWAASTTSQTTRDNVQRLLLGEAGQWGTGAIPKSRILKIKRAAHGVSDAVETILVRHRTGGQSRLTLKSYDQGRQRWQGESLNFVWFDEEPDKKEIYSEGLTRTNATKGLTYMTFTPLLGMSDVVKRFLLDKSPARGVVYMTIEDALHYTPEERQIIIDSYEEYERDARTKGVPVLGSGRIFPVPEELVQEYPPHLPKWWPRIVGLDIGYDHPTAAVWLAWDRDADTIHVYDTYRRRKETPIVHAAAIKARGDWIPVAWPHDALQHDKGSSCEEIAGQYRTLGVKMLPNKATHAPKGTQKEGEGGYGVEAGLLEMLDRMRTGRLRVAKHLHDWWEEYRLYHRKDGKIVKENDDLLSATRIGVMMLRFAKEPPRGKPQAKVSPFRPTDQTMGPLG